MFENNSATLNGKHTYYDYGLYVTNTSPIAPPEAKTQYIEVPGRNGEIDLSEALTGYTIYKNREITLELGGKKPANQWPSFISDFLNEIHGKQVKVVFDDNKDFYYIGRATVQSGYEIGCEVAKFTVKISAEPYKYSAKSTAEPWIWDLFNFINGVIRSYREIQVNGTLKYRIVGSEMPVIPIIIASADMKVVFEGVTYDLQAGKNKIYDIVLLNNEYELTFQGSGTVSIDYKVGRL